MSRAPELACLLPRLPARLPGPLLWLAVAAAALRPPLRGRVECEVPGRAFGRRTTRCSRGVLLLTGPKPASLARTARRSGASLLVLAGELAGQETLATGLRKQTGRSVLTGWALGAYSLLRAAPVLLRWKGVDPDRARVAVMIDPRNPRPGEAVGELLAESFTRVGIWGLEASRRPAYLERVWRSTGTAPVVLASEEDGLHSTDLMVLAAPAGTGFLGHGRRGSEGPPLVIDTRFEGSVAGAPPRGGSGPGPAGRDRPHRSEVLRLAGLSRPEWEGSGPGAHLAPASGLEGVWRIGGVVFLPPPGWSGQVEPGLEDGLVSAALVEGMACALTGRPVPPPRHQHSPTWMRTVGSWVRACGFTPAGLEVFLS